MWGLCSGTVRTICNSKVLFNPTTFFISTSSILRAWQNQKGVSALLSLFFFGPNTQTLPTRWSINDLFSWWQSWGVRQEAETNRYHWKTLWYSQDSTQHQNDGITTYSHASSGLQQRSTCVTQDTCKTASGGFHHHQMLNRIILC